MPFNPNPINADEEARLEEAASKAEDTLGLYKAARGEMVTFLRTLQRGEKNDLTSIASLTLVEIEYSILWQSDGFSTDSRDTAEQILEHLADGRPEVAEQVIDEHFAAYLDKLRDVAGV